MISNFQEFKGHNSVRILCNFFVNQKLVNISIIITDYLMDFVVFLQHNYLETGDSQCLISQTVKSGFWAPCILGSYLLLLLLGFVCFIFYHKRNAIKKKNNSEALCVIYTARGL